jgi:aryl-alcohol dehydrogenase-like predicted oxidoreductase
LRIALGTAQFGIDYGVANQQGKITKREAKDILEYAFENGIKMLDTAMVYGDSEKLLGEIGRDDWQIVTKIPLLQGNSKNYTQEILDVVKKSLTQLNVENVYGVLLHNPQQLLESDGKKIFKGLQQIKNEGHVKNIGVSIYDPVELDELCRRYQFDIVQAPFNIVDRRIVNTNWHERLKEQGTELHVRSIFLQGLLLMTSSRRPNQFNQWEKLWTNWEQWLGKNGLSPLQACLRYALSFPSINKIIVGVDSCNQLKEIVHAVAGSFPDVPDNLQSNDIDLLNPTRWAEL